MPDPQPGTTLGPFDGVLFDNDGVLVDSHAQGEIAWQTLCQRYALPYDEIVTTFVGRRPEDTLGDHLSGARLTSAIDELEALEIELAAETPVLRGASELLEALTLPWTVVTSASLPLMRTSTSPVSEAPSHMALTLPLTFVRLSRMEPSCFFESALNRPSAPSGF